MWSKPETEPRCPPLTLNQDGHEEQEEAQRDEKLQEMDADPGQAPCGSGQGQGSGSDPPSVPGTGNAPSHPLPLRFPTWLLPLGLKLWELVLSPVQVSIERF